MGGHEPGQVTIVLDDEDARAALALPGPPHAAPSQSSAGTLADRRRRSPGADLRRFFYLPDVPDPDLIISAEGMGSLYNIYSATRGTSDGITALGGVMAVNEPPSKIGRASCRERV